jgi:hypothetical protein
MPHFDVPEARLLIEIIRIHRPRWAAQAIMNELRTAAVAGATLGQATAAAERAMRNTKYTAPTSINFPENWQVQDWEISKDKAAEEVTGSRLCIECLTYQPAKEMDQMEDRKWICKRHGYGY